MNRAGWILAALAGLAAPVAACSSGGGDHPAPGFDAGRTTRRVIEPPTGQVRPLPPHAIDPGGVGPYRLGATPQEIAGLLPTFPPRVAVLDIAGVVGVSVIRAEDDTILIGGRPGPNEPVSFIAVLAPDIASTETGIAVGAPASRLDALGPPASEPSTARDPGLVTAAVMPGTWFLVQDEIIRAILLQTVASAPSAPTSPAPPTELGPADAGVATPVTTCAELPAAEADVLAAAGASAPIHARAACLSGRGREAVVVSGTTITVVDGDATRLRRAASLDLPGLAWAAPIRVEPGRDDLIAVVEDRSTETLAVSVVALRLEGGRFSRVAEDVVYRLTRTNVQWIGASLPDVRLMLTVDARPDGFAVGGALVHRGTGPARDVAPLLPVSLARRRRPAGDAAAAVPPVDAGAPVPRDAGRPPDDGGAHRDGAVHPGDGTRHGPDAGPRHPPADAGS